jgi:hypothetical protein
MSNGINTAMKGAKPSGFNAPVDRRLREPSLEQLPTCDDTMLARSHDCDQSLISRWAWSR